MTDKVTRIDEYPTQWSISWLSYVGKPWGRSGSAESRGRLSTAGGPGPLQAARRELRDTARRVRSASAGRDKKQEMAARWDIAAVLRIHDILVWIKKSQNSRNQGFSYFFCLMIEGSGIRAHISD